MNRFFFKLLCLLVLIFVSASVLSAQMKKIKKISKGERLITAPANSDNLPLIFREDSGIFAEGSQGISPIYAEKAIKEDL